MTLRLPGLARDGFDRQIRALFGESHPLPGGPRQVQLDARARIHFLDVVRQLVVAARVEVEHGM